MNGKTFSKLDYEKFNTSGINATIKLLTKYGYELHDATERFKVWDVVFRKGETLLPVEVEV